MLYITSTLGLLQAVTSLSLASVACSLLLKHTSMSSMPPITLSKSLNFLKHYFVTYKRGIIIIANPWDCQES